MFIPNYQIHNILKDFTHQLRNGNHRQDTGHRLETVVNKVAGTIMDRVARLSEEEALHEMTGGGRHAHPSSPLANEQQPSVFHYHTIDADCHKIKKSLSVENPEQLVDRFQSVIDEVGNVAPEK
jgi:hypothetical protein